MKIDSIDKKILGLVSQNPGTEIRRIEDTLLKIGICNSRWVRERIRRLVLRGYIDQERVSGCYRLSLTNAGHEVLERVSA